MHGPARPLSLALAVLTMGAGLGQAPARADDELGGGSDLPSNAVVELPRGGTLPPLHYVFADNPGTRPVEVRFHAEAPKGIEVVPERRRFRIPPGKSIKNRFAVRIGDTVPPGDHRVTVQLIRSDINPEPGKVTNIPAVGTSFTVRISGKAAAVKVRALSAESGKPVDGTLSLSAVAAPHRLIEIARADGNQLSAAVAPGRYRASYLLAGRELASREVRAEPGGDVDVSLKVRTVSFIHVAAKPVEEDGSVVVVELVASVENHLRALSGEVVLRTTVRRDGKRVATVTLDRYDRLATGVTEAKLMYRPETGFVPGRYRFDFELVAADFTVHASDQPTFGVSRPFPFLVVAIVLAGVAAVAAGVWIAVRRRRGLRPRRPR